MLQGLLHCQALPNTSNRKPAAIVNRHMWDAETGPGSVTQRD